MRDRTGSRRRLDVERSSVFVLVLFSFRERTFGTEECFRELGANRIF